MKHEDGEVGKALLVMDFSFYPKTFGKLLHVLTKANKSYLLVEKFFPAAV